MATRSKKKSNNDPSSERVRINCSVSPDTARLIDVLIETGVFGRSRPEVMERLATDQIARMWQDGELSLDKLKLLLITPEQVRALKSQGN